MTPIRSRDRLQGLTLIELMIVVALGLVVVLGAGAVHRGVNASFNRGVHKVVDRREAAQLSTVISRRIRVASDYMIYDVSDRTTPADTGNCLAMLDRDGIVTYRYEWDTDHATLADSTGARVTSMVLRSLVFIADPVSPRTIRFLFQADDGGGDVVDMESAAALRN